MKIKYTLTLFAGLLLSSSNMMAADGAAAIVSLVSKSPDPVCSGSAVSATFKAVTTDPTDKQKEIKITSWAYSWTASDDTGVVATEPNGGASWTVPSWKPSGCGSKTLTASVIVTFSGTQKTGTPNQSSYSTTATGSSSATVQVVTVDSLTTDLSSGQGGLEDGSDPPTYWVCQCPGDIIVTASSCPSLTADQLPDCWTFTGGVTIDKLHHKVSKTALMSGPVTFTVTCGTSTKTITLKADKENALYSMVFPSQSCGTDSFTGAPQCLDACGNFLTIDCVGTQHIYGNWPGHFSYRYDGIWVGTCYYPDGINEFLYKTTKHNCRILKTWHSTVKGTSSGNPASPSYWTVTTYS